MSHTTLHRGSISRGLIFSLVLLAGAVPATADQPRLEWLSHRGGNLPGGAQSLHLGHVVLFRDHGNLPGATRAMVAGGENGVRSSYPPYYCALLHPRVRDRAVESADLSPKPRQHFLP